MQIATCNHLFVALGPFAQAPAIGEIELKKVLPDNKNVVQSTIDEKWHQFKPECGNPHHHKDE